MLSLSLAVGLYLANRYEHKCQTVSLKQDHKAAQAHLQCLQFVREAALLIK